MKYKTGTRDDYAGERFLTFSEASDFLGIRSYSRISEMVRKGMLPAFELPDTDRLRVRKRDVLALIQLHIQKQQGK